MKIPIVNEQDEILYYKDTQDRNPKEEISRVAALWITDSEGNILLAQRAFSKKNDPGLWGPAVAGTVEEGETYESNIIKEAGEEIGLYDFTPVLGPKVRRSTSHEYFGQWFTTIIPQSTNLIRQESEVEMLKWFTPVELKNLYTQKPEIFLKDFDRYFDLFSI